MMPQTNKTNVISGRPKYTDFGKKISNFLSNFWPDFFPKINNSGPIFKNGVAYKKKGVIKPNCF